MKKISLASSLIIAGIVATASLTSAVSATTYTPLPSPAIGNTATTDSTVGFQSASPIDPVVPPLDPQAPDPTNPVAPPQGGSGPLSIDYVSNLNFGINNITNTNATYYAKAEVLSAGPNAGKNSPDYIQVTDNTGSFKGWALTVKQNDEFRLSGSAPSSTAVGDILTGAQLMLSKGQVNGIAGVPTSVNPTGTATINLSSSAQNVMTAATNQGMGTWIYAMGTGADYNGTTSPVSLSVPGTTMKKAGVYSTTLTWTLQQTP